MPLKNLVRSVSLLINMLACSDLPLLTNVRGHFYHTSWDHSSLQPNFQALHVDRLFSCLEPASKAFGPTLAELVPSIFWYECEQIFTEPKLGKSHTSSAAKSMEIRF